MELILITLAQVKKAYKDIGYTPCSEMFLGNGNECCPLSAILIQDGYDPSINTIISGANKRFGDNFVTSFVAGFDGCVYNDFYDKVAFDNGLKIRKGLHVK